MALNPALLRSSFKNISMHAEKLASRFYEILFDRYPEVRPLFHNSRLEDQKKMLLRALALIVRKVDDEHYLTNFLQGLGKTHVAYGAEPEHYDAFTECLLAALEEIAGREWTKEAETNWKEALGMVRNLMLEGAAK